MWVSSTEEVLAGSIVCRPRNHAMAVSPKCGLQRPKHGIWHVEDIVGQASHWLIGLCMLPCSRLLQPMPEMCSCCARH